MDHKYAVFNKYRDYYIMKYYLILYILHSVKDTG